jgi:hypothetical protein
MKRDTSHMAGLGGRWNDAPTIAVGLDALTRLCTPVAPRPVKHAITVWTPWGTSSVMARGLSLADAQLKLEEVRAEFRKAARHAEYEVVLTSSTGETLFRGAP